MNINGLGNVAEAMLVRLGDTKPLTIGLDVTIPVQIQEAMDKKSLG